MIVLGHATNDENGKSVNGLAGNQGKELNFQEWYLRSKGWTHVFRAKSTAKRKKIAQAMMDAVNNKHIGYDQNQRTTLDSYARLVNYDLKKVVHNCETDCSALVAVCCNSAGIPVNKGMYTGNEYDVLKATGKFYIYTSSKYTNSPDKLKVGDILLGAGHTSIVVSDTYLVTRQLRKGTIGSDVKAVQNRLNELGFNCGLADGDFGNNTLKAVEAFQISKMLQADGIVGRKTVESLGFIYF